MSASPVISQAGLLIMLVTVLLYIIFSLTITYHWLSFSPTKAAAAKFLTGYYVASAVLFLTMAITWSLF